MAGDAALVLKMEARLRDFERQMQNAAKIADKSAADIEKRFAKVNPKGFSALRNEASGLVPILSRVGGAFAAIAGGLKFVDAVQQFTNLQNSLKTTGLEGVQLQAVYQALFDAAQRQGAPVESLVTLYSRLALSQKELGVTGSQLVSFTEQIALALRVSGTSAGEASGALLQLGQLLGGGVVQAEEFNSVLDGTPAIAQAVAAGLEEAGGSVSKLRQLVKDGEVSSAAFFKAFQAGSVILEERASKMEGTVSQASARLQNAFLQLAGSIDEVNKVSGTTASIIDGIAAAMERAAVAFPKYSKMLAEAGGGDVLNEKYWERVISDDKAEKAAEKAGEAIKAGLIPKEKLKFENFFDGPAPQQKIATVSTKDNPVPTKEKMGRGGGGGSSRAARPDEFAREVEQYQKRTGLLQLEAETLGQSIAAVERAKAVYDLLNAAKEAGTVVTDKVREKIEQEATAYGVAAQQLEEARQKLDEINQFSEEFGSALSNAFTDAIVNGEKLDQVLQNLLKQLASMAINSAFQSLFSSKGNGGSVVGNALASLLGIGGARAAGGPVAGGTPYLVGEKGPEIFTPGRSGMIIPNSVAAGGAGGSGGAIVVHQNNSWSGGFSEREKAEIIRAQRQATVVAVQEAMQRRKL